MNNQSDDFSDLSKNIAQMKQKAKNIFENEEIPSEDLLKKEVASSEFLSEISNLKKKAQDITKKLEAISTNEEKSFFNHLMFWK